MGIFNDIFGGKERREREMGELMNPLLGWRLQHFVVILDDPVYLALFPVQEQAGR
jgi:hypothetical protein